MHYVDWHSLVLGFLLCFNCWIAEGLYKMHRDKEKDIFWVQLIVQVFIIVVTIIYYHQTFMTVKFI